MMPHDDFYNFTYQLKDIFIQNFPSISYDNGVDVKLKV